MNLICAVTENYLDRACHFLESLDVVKKARVLCVCHGFEVSPELKAYSPHIEFFTMPRCPTESNGMIQHGRFLDALPFLKSDDLVVLTDADVIVQRDFSADEIHLFNSFDENTWSAGPNQQFGRQDTLYDEARRIYIKHGYLGRFPEYDFTKIPVWNLGVMVGRVSFFRRVQEEYEKDCMEFYQNCDHRSRAQFQFCFALHRMAGPKKILELSQVTHTHGHFGTPPNAELRTEYMMVGKNYSVDGTLYWNNFRVMFRHYL